MRKNLLPFYFLKTRAETIPVHQVDSHKKLIVSIKLYFKVFKNQKVLNSKAKTDEFYQNNPDFRHR